MKPTSNVALWATRIVPSQNFWNFVRTSYNGLAGKKNGVKIIYGVEANLVEDKIPIVYNETDVDMYESTYVVFDVETTGLSAVHNDLIQIAATKMHKGNPIDEFDEFINPGYRLSEFTTELTRILYVPI